MGFERTIADLDVISESSDSVSGVRCWGLGKATATATATARARAKATANAAGAVNAEERGEKQRQKL